MLKSCDCVLGALLRRWQRPVGEFEGSERIGDGHQRTANGQGNSQARRRSREQLPGLFGLHVNQLHAKHEILHLLSNTPWSNSTQLLSVFREPCLRKHRSFPLALPVILFHL